MLCQSSGQMKEKNQFTQKKRASPKSVFEISLNKHTKKKKQTMKAVTTDLLNIYF